HHSLTLTTIPFGYSGSRRFDTCSCKPMPKSHFLHLPYSFTWHTDGVSLLVYSYFSRYIFRTDKDKRFD
ncbi:MAG: hypothetical protein ABIF18_00980, partial [archaeon]